MSARKLRFVLAPDARTDLRDLLVYTDQQWGRAQRRAYKRRLDEAFDTLARFPELGRMRPEYGPHIRSHRVRQHVIIYQTRETELRIVRILHVRRDFEAELSELDEPPL